MENVFRKLTFILFVLLLVLTAQVYAGTTGKIAGTVRDAETNEPLPFCNIIIVGTNLGAASDINGNFFIINIPPGKYTIRFSMVGYKTYTINNVTVISDQTTKLDIKMEKKVLEMENEVVVVSQRPLVQKDLTSKVAVISTEDIINMPIQNLNEILTTKAGFTTDAEGNLHVRGGRTGELSYMIDGVKVENPLNSGFTETFNKDAINEMVVISGTFNAEYGDAMSGIVNIVTKDGGTSFHGRVEYTSQMLNQSPYRTKNPFPGVQDKYDYVEKSVLDLTDIAIPGILRASLGGPIVPSLRFFISGVVNNEDSYLPHGYNIGKDGFGKLTYIPNSTFKISLSGQYTKSKIQRYSHPWKYLSENQAHTTTTTNRAAVVVTHTLSSKFFYTANLSRFENHTKVQVDDKLPSEYERGITGETVFFFVSGDDSRYSDNNTVTYRGRMDATWQANQYHQFKGGFELVGHNIKVHNEIEPWPSGAQFKDIYNHNPLEFSAYVQDKIEYDYLIVNVGLRYDYVDPRASMWPDIYRFGYFDENNNWILSELVPVKPKTQLSPRIGLAHPITDKAVLHFAYGHFFQFPDYNSLYYNNDKDLGTSLPLVGNPDVKPQKTVSFEAGIKYQFSDNWALDATAWYKDITDLLSTLQISYLSQDYVVFYNSDYASVKGIDITFNKRYSEYFSGSLDYTYMIAKGNNSQPLGGYFNAFEQEEVPHQEYFLDFDQRHNLAVNFNFYIPQNNGILSELNLNFIFRASSGLPYTPYVDPTVRIEINSARKPWTSTFDFRLQKNISFSSVSLALFLQINNLFDTQNVVNVYPRTGKPFDTGLPGLVGSSPDADHNPANVGPPRIIKLGAQFIW